MDRILEAGHPIVLVPTFAMKDFRRRYAVGGAKSDRGDCYVLADMARTDGHRLRRLELLSAQTRALRAVVRTRDDLVDQRKAVANQLRATLEAYWPAPRRSSPTSTPRSTWRSFAATRPRSRPPASARPAWPAS